MKKVFKKENLDYTDFSNSCLIGVSFDDCSLRFCQFKDSDLSYSKFENCDIYCSSFQNAVLYTTRFISCDATKADFNKSYLNGLRIKDTNVTHTIFGFYFNTGLERKPEKELYESLNYLQLELGKTNLPKNISELEKEYDGIYCITTNIIIRFIKTGNSNWRVFRRKSEIAKIIKNILEDNGYTDKSTDYYFFHRKFHRKSIQNWPLRFLDYFWGELFWGYGVRVKNPLIAFFINCIIFSLIYSFLPFVDNNSGIEFDDKILTVFSSNGGINYNGYLNVLYWSILISSLSVFGNMNVVGYAKVFSVIHVLISVLSLGLGVSALTRKMANI